MERYIPHYFKAQELVPRFVYELLGFESYFLFDSRILITADQLREYFGKAYINDWSFGGKLQERGFRLRHSQVGAFCSMHKEAKALDITFKKIKAEDVRKKIIQKQHLFPFITRLEGKAAWLHFDIKVTGKKGIVIFNP